MKIFLPILLMLVVWGTTVSSQTSSCYQQLSYLSGTEFTAGQLSDLEQAACDLIDSLPQAYQDSFAILDYGFYLHNRSMDQGVEDIWPEVIQAADSISPYYLLLGRVPGREGAVKVEVKMPSSSFFSCFDEQTKNYFESVNSVNGIEYISDFVNEMVTTMEKLAYEIKKWEACCSTNLKSETCAVCPDNISEFRAFLENNGFISAPVSSLSYSENDHQKGVVHALYDISCTLPDGSSLDINLDVETYLNSIATKVEGIEGNIAHYDPANLNCTDVLEWVNGIPSVALQGNPNSRTKSKASKSSQDRYLLKMDVITTEDAGGNVEVHMRTTERVNSLPPQSNDCGSVYLTKIDGNLDLNIMINYLDTFWEIIIYGPENQKKPYLKIEPNKVEWSDLEELDAVCVIGEGRCEIKRFINDNYKNANYEFNCNRLSLEMGQTGDLKDECSIKVMSWVSLDDLMPDQNGLIWEQISYNLGLEKVVALIVLHANTHNTGLQHKIQATGGGYYPTEEYFSHRSKLKHLLGNPNITETYHDPEALILRGRDIIPWHGRKNGYVDMTIRDWLIKRFVKNK